MAAPMTEHHRFLKDSGRRYQKATLSDEEIYALTRATQPAAQLRRLVAAGFVRARIERGHVILERPHYIAVSGGNATAADKPRPTIRKVGRHEPA